MGYHARMDKEQAAEKILTEPTDPVGNDEAANLLMDDEAEEDGEATDRRE